MQPGPSPIEVPIEKIKRCLASGYIYPTLDNMYMWLDGYCKPEQKKALFQQLLELLFVKDSLIATFKLKVPASSRDLKNGEKDLYLVESILNLCPDMKTAQDNPSAETKLVRQTYNAIYTSLYTLLHEYCLNKNPETDALNTHNSRAAAQAAVYDRTIPTQFRLSVRLGNETTAEKERRRQVSESIEPHITELVLQAVYAETQKILIAPLQPAAVYTPLIQAREKGEKEKKGKKAKEEPPKLDPRLQHERDRIRQEMNFDDERKKVLAEEADQMVAQQLQEEVNAQMAREMEMEWNSQPQPPQLPAPQPALPPTPPLPQEDEDWDWETPPASPTIQIRSRRRT
jgi:hypothetical protein